MLSRLITVCLVTGGGALSIKCGGRLPLQSWGADLFCGVGAPACPIGSYCHIDSDGFSNFAVCCPNILASFPLYTSSLPLSLPLLPPAPLPLASTPLYSDFPAPAAPLYSAASSALPAAPLYSPAPAALPAVPLYAGIVKPPTIPEPEICPETGKQKLSCPINSCLTSDCFGVPGASCMVDYCGNCGPKWYGPYNQVLTPEQCNWLPAWNARLQAFATVQNQAQPMSALNFGPIQPQSQFTQASFQSPLAVSSSAPASNFQSLWESPQFSAQFAASPQSISSPQFSQQFSSQPISSPEFSAQISQPLSSPEFSAQSSSQPQISAQISSQPISSPQLSAQFSSQPISSPQLSAQTETIVPLPSFQKNVAGTRCPAPPDCSLDFLKASNSTMNKMAESAADKQEKIWQEQAQQTTCRYENPQMAPNGCLMGCGTLVCEGPVRFLEIAMGQNSAVATWVPPLSAALGQTYTAELSYDGINWRNLPLEQPWATFARFEVEENRPFQVRVTAAGYPSIVKKFEFSGNATMPVASTQIIETEPNMEASMEAPEGSLEASISL